MKIQDSLIDIFPSLKKRWKFIAACGIGGLFFGIIFVAVTPNKFEAIATIEVAQYISRKYPSGINVEEPSELAARLNLLRINNKCDISINPNLVILPGDSIYYSAPKNTAKYIQLRVIDSSSELANNCVKILFNDMLQSQSQRLGEYLLNQITINSYELNMIDEFISEGTGVLTRNSKFPEFVSSSNYLHFINEVRQQKIKRNSLVLDMEGISLVTPKIIFPINSSFQPVYPNKRIALAVGFCWGTLFGFILVLTRQVINRLKI